MKSRALWLLLAFLVVKAPLVFGADEITAKDLGPEYDKQTENLISSLSKGVMSNPNGVISIFKRYNDSEKGMFAIYCASSIEQVLVDVRDVPANKGEPGFEKEFQAASQKVKNVAGIYQYLTREMETQCKAGKKPACISADALKQVIARFKTNHANFTKGLKADKRLSKGAAEQFIATSNKLYAPVLGL